MLAWLKKGWLIGGVVGFALGAIFVIASVKVYFNQLGNPQKLKDKFYCHLQTQLDLTDDQLSKVEHILDEKKAKYKSLHYDMKPQLLSLKSEAVQEVKDILDDDQDSKLEDFMGVLDKKIDHVYKKLELWFEI